MHANRTAAEALVIWLDAASAYLRATATPRYLEARRWFQRDHAYVNEHVIVGTWEIVDLQRTMTLPEWEAFRTAALADDWVRQQLENDGVAFDNTWRPLSFESIPFQLFRTVILPDTKSLPQVTDEIRNSARAFVDWLFRRSVTAIIIQPVFGVFGNADVLLSDGIILKRSLSERIVQLLDWDVLPPSFATQMVWDNSVPEYTIEFSLDHPKSLERPAAPDAGVHVELKRREYVAASFSLISSGRVEMNGAFVGYEPLSIWGGGVQPATTHMYSLSRSVDVDALRDELPIIYEALRPVDMRVGKGLAIRRLGQAASRDYYEDKLLDLMIAAEAVFLPDERLELAYKLALRCSYYLEPDDQGRRERIFYVIRAAYGKRGSVAHGDPIGETVSIGTQQLTMQDFLREVEEILRRALRKLLGETGKVNFDALVLGAH